MLGKGSTSNEFFTKVKIVNRDSNILKDIKLKILNINTIHKQFVVFDGYNHYPPHAKMPNLDFKSKEKKYYNKFKKQAKNFTLSVIAKAKNVRNNTKTASQTKINSGFLTSIGLTTTSYKSLNTTRGTGITKDSTPGKKSPVIIHKKALSTKVEKPLNFLEAFSKKLAFTQKDKSSEKQTSSQERMIEKFKKNKHLHTALGSPLMKKNARNIISKCEKIKSMNEMTLSKISTSNVSNKSIEGLGALVNFKVRSFNNTILKEEDYGNMKTETPRLKYLFEASKLSKAVPYQTVTSSFFAVDYVRKDILEGLKKDKEKIDGNLFLTSRQSWRKGKFDQGFKSKAKKSATLSISIELKGKRDVNQN